MSINTKNQQSNFETDKNATNKEKRSPHTFSRRDVLKASWTVPVVLAVTPSDQILAGSGGGGGTDPTPVIPTPDYDWDKSSIQVTAKGCDSRGNAVFEIKNGGAAMQGPHGWRAYIDLGGKTNGDLIAQGVFELGKGESVDVRIAATNYGVRLFAGQHPDHPGNSEPQASVNMCTI